MTLDFHDRKLSTTNKRQISRRTIASIALVAAAAISVLVIGFAGSNSANVPTQLRNAYVAPPRQLLADSEIRFARLPATRLNEVRIMPNVAARIAMKPVRGVGHPRVAFESLGGYVDESRIIPDWVGTKSWVPKAVPAYLVRLTGVNIEPLGPANGGVIHNEIVIVNAITGELEGTTIYG